MLHIILEFLGIFLLWCAVEYKRTSKLILFTKDWWVILVILLIAYELIKNN